MCGIQRLFVFLSGVESTICSVPGFLSDAFMWI